MQHSISKLAILCLTIACAGASTGVPATPPPAGERQGDPRLYALLGAVPLAPAAQDSLDAYEREHWRDFMEQVGLVAEDPVAGLEARYNAVRIIGERRAAAQLPALRAAATDPDPRVRAAVVVAAARIAEKNGEGRSLVEAALVDRAAEVQAKALELIGTSNLPLLRGFLARHDTGEIATIARSLVRVAEERGAPLAGDSAGALRRVLDEGVTLRFQPVRRLPEANAAIGTLTVTPRQGAAFSVDSIEVVQNVVPAFFSADARHIVYERGRSIHVRDLQTGATRALGPGIAPRPRPFTGDFVFMREVAGSRGEVRDRIRVRYEVVRAGFAAESPAPSVLGAIDAFSQMRLNGGFAPVRWMRVIENEGAFTLEAEGMETFRLPDPFRSGDRP